LPEYGMKLVRRRTEKFYKIMDLYYAYQIEHRGSVRIWGGRYRTTRVVNWDWPPRPGRPVWGWRSRLVAMELRRRWFHHWGGVPPWTLKELVYAGKGGSRIGVGDLRRWRAAWERQARRREKPKMAVGLVAGGPPRVAWIPRNP